MKTSRIAGAVLVVLAAAAAVLQAGPPGSPGQGMIPLPATLDAAKPVDCGESQQAGESWRPGCGARPLNATPTRRVKTQIHEDARCGWGGCCYHQSNAVCYLEINCGEDGCAMGCA